MNINQCHAQEESFELQAGFLKYSWSSTVCIDLFIIHSDVNECVMQPFQQHHVTLHRQNNFFIQT